MSKEQFNSDREFELFMMSREDAAFENQRISTEQEDYLISLIDKSGYRNSDKHDEIEREILNGIDSERFDAIKSDLEANQIDPFTLGDSSATSIKNHLRKL